MSTAGEKKMMKMTVLFLMSFLASSQLHGQSLAASAKEQRETLCKAGRTQFCDKDHKPDSDAVSQGSLGSKNGSVLESQKPDKMPKMTTQRVFTDDDVKHGDPNQVEAPQVDAPAAKTSTSAPTGNVDIEAKTPEQLGYDCYGGRFAGFNGDGDRLGFPASSWRQRLSTVHSALVDAADDWNSNHTAASLTSLTAAQTAFTETHGGCRAAILAWDKIEGWKASHLGEGPWTPPACTTFFCH